MLLDSRGVEFVAKDIDYGDKLGPQMGLLLVHWCSTLLDLVGIVLVAVGIGLEYTLAVPKGFDPVCILPELDWLRAAWYHTLTETESNCLADQRWSHSPRAPVTHVAVAVRI